MSHPPFTDQIGRQAISILANYGVRLRGFTLAVTMPSGAEVDLIVRPPAVAGGLFPPLPEPIPHMPTPTVSPTSTEPETSPRHDPVLTDLQADLLDAIRKAKRPRKGINLARDCQRPWNSKAREALSDLCQLGLAVRAEGGGYESAGRDVVT